MRERSPPPTGHVSHFMCHVSSVTCHMSSVTCKHFFLQSGETCRGRVCYEHYYLQKCCFTIFNTIQLYLEYIWCILPAEKYIIYFSILITPNCFHTFNKANFNISVGHINISQLQRAFTVITAQVYQIKLIASQFTPHVRVSRDPIVYGRP